MCEMEAKYFFSQEFSAPQIFATKWIKTFECQSLKSVTEKIAKDIFIVKNLSLSHYGIT